MPSIGTNSKPAYVYDAGTDTWIPIGPGEHTHDYSASAHNHDSTYIAKTLTTTTGDIIYASSANTPARLGIGSSAQVLTVSGGIPTWSTPVSGGLTLLSTTSVTNATTTISSISGDYKYLLIYFYNLGTTNSNPSLSITFNSSSIFSGTRITSWDTNFQSTSLDDAGLTTSFAHSGNGTTSQTGIIQIYNYANTTNHKVIEAVSAYSSSDPYDISNKYSGRLKTTSAISSVTFTWGGTTGLQGTIEIYGGK